MTHFEGGYFLHKHDLVRDGLHAHTAADLDGLSTVTVNSVNLVQATPWEINSFILSVVSGLYGLGNVNDKDGKTILRFEEPISPRQQVNHPAMQQLDPEEWSALSQPEKKKVRQRRAQAYKEYEKQLGSYRSNMRTIELAKEYSGMDRFYFPHNLDFRTRMYPIPNDLTPQGNDLQKGLLRFKRPTPLGDQGLYWLGFSVATHYGMDKLHPDDRYLWAFDNLDMIREAVRDPIQNTDLWVGADKPLQFLAAASEWDFALASGAKEDFYSHLPGNLDGSCNGAQHLSILTRDKDGAYRTNCGAQRDRTDLYQEVADVVMDEVLKAKENGSPEADDWYPLMVNPSDRRKVVKRSVMTKAYGVTERGIADFLMKENVSAEWSEQWRNAMWLRDLIWKAIETALPKGVELQNWISECAGICGDNGLPMEWSTPAGSKIVQGYRNLIETRIPSYNTRFVIMREADEDDDVGMQTEKMMTSAPPNVIHSFDAAHLQRTVVMMAEAGIQDFSMIHDSFGCPMAYVGLMRDILRDEAIRMYEDNWLMNLKWDIEENAAKRGVDIELPMPPSMGEFDLEEIRQSDFFFS